MKRGRQKLRERLVIGSAVLLGLGGCTGRVSGGAGVAAGGAGSSGGATAAAGTTGAAGATSSPTAAGWPAFGPTATFGLRRLTTEQYETSAATLLGVATTGMPPIEDVSAVAGFAAIGATSGSVSSAGVGQFENAAWFLAQAAFAPAGPRQALVPCTPTGPGDATCLGAFVTSFGRRAFRRPLTTDEVTRYTAVASQVASRAWRQSRSVSAMISDRRGTAG